MSRVVEVPAMVNAHSHAFQIGLRGIGERPVPAAAGEDDFWSWRTAMYDLAGRLDPEAMHRVALRAYGEMKAAGYGAVGEFHYVHHAPDGTPYADRNEMAKAVAAAAAERDLRIVLLPAAYHRAGWDGSDLPPQPGQRRFCDPDVETYLARIDELRSWAQRRPGVQVGVAAHSVRAVPAAWLAAIADYADGHGLVRHVHAHEQAREIDECRAEHGCSPSELLDRCGFLGPTASVVHGIHVTAADIALLAARDATVVTCPTTEGNLGDGHLPALAYRDAGVRLAIGSDSQVRIDPFEEIREMETGARRDGQTRTALLAGTEDLWADAAASGRRALGLAGPDVAPLAIALDHPLIDGMDARDLPLALATCATPQLIAR